MPALFKQGERIAKCLVIMVSGLLILQYFRHFKVNNEFSFKCTLEHDMVFYSTGIVFKKNMEENGFEETVPDV